MSARILPSPEPLVAEARRLRPPFRAIAISAAKGPNRIPKEAGTCRKNEAECAKPHAGPNRDQANGRLRQAEARSQSPHSSIQRNRPQQPATATGHSNRPQQLGRPEKGIGEGKNLVSSLPGRRRENLPICRPCPTYRDKRPTAAL